MVANKHGRFSSYTLPEELTEQIIARVSCVKSILRCTSVCKSWYGLIYSTNFIKLHLSLIPYVNNNKLLLCEFRGDDLSYFETSIVFKGLEWMLNGSLHVRREIRGFLSQGPYFAIHNDSEGFEEHRLLLLPRFNILHVHACNGLICYDTFDDPYCLYLWNPTTDREKRISTPLPNLNHGHHDAAFSLWFDKRVSDYKILRITYTTKTCTVEVYSLSSNSWRLITDDGPVPVSGLSSNSLAYIKGTFYWPVLRDGNWILISLDIENETFEERLTKWNASILYLIHSDHDDSLFIFGYQHQVQPAFNYRYYLSVFEVRDHGLNISYTIPNDIYDPSSTFLPWPMSFRNNGDLLIRDYNWDSMRDIISFCIKTAEFKKLAYILCGTLRHAIPFVETIALLDDADAIKIKRTNSTKLRY